VAAISWVAYSIHRFVEIELMPKFTLFIIGLAAMLVVTVTLTARLLLPPVSQPEPQVALGDQTQTTSIPHIPALQDVRQSVRLSLDAEWDTVILSAAELEQLLYRIGPDQGPAQQTAAASLLGGIDGEASVILASHRSGASLQVVALKRNELTLDAYLAAVGQQLSTAGATLYSSGVDATLRTDRLPAARLSYSLMDQPASDLPVAVAGMQVATFDAPAARLVIFTLTGQLGQSEELALLMGHILAAAAF
jgi:hypothetical protein